MTQRKIAPILVGGLLLAGLILIGLGWIWGSLVPSSAYWGPQEAEELIKAQADLHAKTHSHGTHEHNDQEFAAARNRLATIQHQLDSARNSRDRTGTYLAALGILLSLAGIALHFAAKQPS